MRLPYRKILISTALALGLSLGAGVASASERGAAPASEGTRISEAVSVELVGHRRARRSFGRHHRKSFRHRRHFGHRFHKRYHHYGHRRFGHKGFGRRGYGYRYSY